MKLKKLLALALAGVLMLALLTGCSGGATGEDRLVAEAVADIFKRFKKIVVCELNEGQFANYLRGKLQQFDYEQYNKCEGQPFTVTELTNKFHSLLK